MTQLQAMKTAFITLIVIFLLSSVYMFTQVTTYSKVEITEEEVFVEDGQHFLLIDNRKLKLSNSLFQHLQLDQYHEYRIIYSYNKLTQTKGKVEDLQGLR